MILSSPQSRTHLSRYLKTWPEVCLRYPPLQPTIVRAGDITGMEEFCQACKDLLHGNAALSRLWGSPDHSFEFTHHQGITLLKLASNEGCSLCRFIWNSFTEDEKSRVDDPKPTGYDHLDQRTVTALFDLQPGLGDHAIGFSIGTSPRIWKSFKLKPFHGL